MSVGGKLDQSGAINVERVPARPDSCLRQLGHSEADRSRWTCPVVLREMNLAGLTCGETSRSAR